MIIPYVAVENKKAFCPSRRRDNGDGSTRTAHAAKPRTKWMKNGILGLRSKAGGRFAIKSASLERGQATFEHTELRFDRVH